MKIKINEMPLSLSWIAAVTGGILYLNDLQEMPTVSHICTDSREADAQTLFCAIPGERVDGFDYIPAAVALGCRAVLSEKKPDAAVSSVVVEDTVVAMGKLAEAYQAAYLPELFTVGVTGSVGKTTTKECIAAVLSVSENLFKKEGNHNSTVGMPLSVMEITHRHTAAVLEMGMSDFGEIAAMSKTVHPAVACITNIGTSHMEHLGSREGIAKAKLEMLQGMKEGSTLLINGDEPLLSCVPALCHAGRITCLRVSLCDPTADYYAFDIHHENGGMQFELMMPGQRQASLEIPAVGIHTVWAAAFASAVGDLRGMRPPQILAGLRTYHPASMRQTISVHEGITLIEDCYNAAPESMAAALSVLQLTAKGRMIAVLGDMKELGEETVALHRQVGEHVAALAKHGEIHLFTVGELGAEIAGEAAKHLPTSHVYCTSEESPYIETIRALKAFLQPGDTVLFKASRAMTLEVISQALTVSE